MLRWKFQPVIAGDWESSTRFNVLCGDFNLKGDYDKETAEFLCNNLKIPVQPEIPVLDAGYVQLVDWMGTDTAICDAARISVNGGVRKGKPSAQRDEKLIKYLIEHGHWSVFEQVFVKLRIKLPIFVMRQLIRHKSGFFNEASGRYSNEIYDDFYLPTLERLTTETTKDSRQGSGKIENTDDSIEALEIFDSVFKTNKEKYDRLIEMNCSDELARLVLPLSTYTECYYTASLRSIIHLISERLDNHAQWEIRQYAKVILDIAESLFPVSMRYAKEKYNYGD